MTEGYSNVNDFIVILADDRNPEESWRRHRAVDRGLGGVDCVARIGTAIFAPADCVTSNIANNGTGGNTVTMDFGDGWRDQFMHLSKFVPEGAKRKGDLVGYSGDSAAPGQPHVHWHRIGVWHQDEWGTTNRFNPWHYFTSPADDDITPVTGEEPFIMATGVIYTDDASNQARSGAIVDTESGLFSAFGNFSVAYANGIARGFGLPQAASVTRGQYNAVKADLANFRALRYGK